jgi:hypothetical protein
MKITPKEVDQFDELIHNDETKFEDLTIFDRNGLAPISKNNLYGLIDVAGNLVIDFQYQSIVMSTINAYSVSKDNLWGFVTKSNQIIIPIEYDLASDFIENVCAVKKQGKWGFIDLLNQVVIPFDYDGCTDFKAGIAGVVKNDKWGVINKSNELIIDYQYEYLTPVDQNFLSFGKATSLKVERPDILAYFPYFLSKDNYLMHFGLLSINNEIILDAVSELPVLESFDGNPVIRKNYQLGYLKDMKDFVIFDQFKIDPYEEKILKQINVMK